ncbi:MAG: SynChlorMet cassette protein ScmC [Chloroflexi bacterium]|nr:SynChlorMet cassette protein ScmC [Chloroflexota bacterium]MBU1751988.1 SynChlorMet cassette protein ScmC [Chloroflexota bacterium]
MDPRNQPGLALSLADGTRWFIRAGDTIRRERDPDAARVVSALGAAMQLRPLPCETGGTGGGAFPAGRELLVTVGRGKTPPANLAGPGPVVCNLSPLLNDDMLNINVTHLALTIVRDAQSRGGVLVHGALAQAPPRRDGAGIILAGPGTVGKTTASNRLPSPWRSLCDDAALVVRDPAGQYWTHPWPTWSRFYSDGPGGSWDVQRAVPLRAIFFLSQSPDDRAEPLHVTQATAMLLETVQHVSRPMTRHMPDDKVQALYQEQLAAVEDLARAIPAYTLHISLTGQFWKELELVLASTETTIIDREATTPSLRGRQAPEAIPAGRHEIVLAHQPRPAMTTVEDMLNDGVLHVVYTGPSMNPTLAEPDLLEVVAYGDRPVQPGDVVYFQPPDGGREVVHRVVRVTPGEVPQGGVRTRGDNNPQEDPYLLQPADIIGQVVAAQRGDKRRRIVGGRRGVLRGMACRPRRVVNRGVSRLLHGAYCALAGAGRFRSLLPTTLRPRVFSFQARSQTFLKLLMGQHVVGQYDTQQKQWRIRRPLRLFVDEASLPVPEPRHYTRAMHLGAGHVECGMGGHHDEDSAAGPRERPVV